MSTFDPRDPVGSGFRADIASRIDDFVLAHRDLVAGIAPELAGLTDLAAAFTEGGKRLRPAFCYWGHLAVGEPGAEAALLQAAASLDLLHVSALIHDDVMDASDVRRGMPAAHRQLEELHRASGLLGSPEAFGRAGAILLGDLLLVWSMEMFTAAGLGHKALTRALPLLDAVRTEVTCGQFLDVHAQAQPLDGRGDLMVSVERVVEFKTARYTVIRPLQLGAAIAGGSAEQLDALGRFGSAVGRAFQFRDDVLGVFGEPAVTGKPAGDDLREGKRTVLVAQALAAASPAQAARLAQVLGEPGLTTEDLADVREIIVATGALASTEERIARDLADALATVEGAPLTGTGRIALRRLAELSATRTS